MGLGQERTLAQLTSVRRLAVVGAMGLAFGAMGLAFGVIGCAAPVAADSERTAESRHGIIDGSVSDDDDAVVGITARGQLYCTGTLVAGHVVLTAAHCLPPSAPIEASEIAVHVGTRFDDTGWLIPTTDLWVHPEHVAGATGRDVGLLALQHAPGAPIPLAAGPPAVGTELRIVGYGRIDADTTSDDVRRAGIATVSSVDDDTMILTATPSVTCGGDSGGPAIATDDDGARVVGVHARGTCEFEMTEMRADPYSGDLAAFEAQNPAPACDADGRCAQGCEPRDEDCPVFEEKEEPPAPEIEEGCTIAPGSASPFRFAGSAWLVCVAASAVRRRRSSARRWRRSRR